MSARVIQELLQPRHRVDDNAAVDDVAKARADVHRLVAGRPSDETGNVPHGLLPHFVVDAWADSDVAAWVLGDHLSRVSDAVVPRV